MSIFDSPISMDRWMRREGGEPSPFELEGTNVGQAVITAGGVAPFASSINSNSINSGEMGSVLSFVKKDFTDTAEGWIQGMDRDGKYKWIIGGATQSIDWAVTTASTLTIKGTLVSS